MATAAAIAIDIKRARTIKRCTKCDGRNASDHKWCQTCRDLGMLYLTKYRAGHAKKGLCPHCVQPWWKYKRGEHYSQCKYHHQYQLDLGKRLRDERVAAGLCTKCKAPADGYYCDDCKVKNASYRKKKSKRHSSVRIFKRAA